MTAKSVSGSIPATVIHSISENGELGDSLRAKLGINEVPEPSVLLAASSASFRR